MISNSHENDFIHQCISVYWSTATSMPRTVNKSTDAATTSMLSSSEKSQLDIVSMLLSLCSSPCSSFVCIASTLRRMDLKSAIIVWDSKSVHVIRWMTMCWCVDVNLCRVTPSNDTMSASRKHLSNLHHHTHTKVKVSGFTQHLYCRLTLEALGYGSQFYLQITPYVPLSLKHSPDGATTGCSSRHLIAA